MQKQQATTNVPEDLKRLQEWFGSIIERPIDINSRMMLESPSGRPMEEEACKFIAPSPTLSPHQRIELYNQQYWWRLLTIMHQSFPFVTRLFGFTDFNERIATPFLCRYRPDSWSLAYLGERLPRFLRETYREGDRRIIVRAAMIDNAYNNAFLVRPNAPLNLQKVGPEVMSLKLTLQPHITLYDMPYHLFSFRDAIVAQDNGDYWMDHPFPALEKGRRFYFILCRSPHNQIVWSELSQAQYHLLKCFKNGCTAMEACDWLEKQDKPFVEDALENLHLWFQDWILSGWLAIKSAHL
ncbi:MAG: putative DNA-binding domain-containing protein [Chlamydiales bacterium]|nr:putative DNA-binding domain-containing protein [Chlamydiales bacterium]